MALSVSDALRYAGYRCSWAVSHVLGAASKGQDIAREWVHMYTGDLARRTSVIIMIVATTISSADASLLSPNRTKSASFMFLPWNREYQHQKHIVSGSSWNVVISKEVKHPRFESAHEVQNSIVTNYFEVQRNMIRGSFIQVLDVLLCQSRRVRPLSLSQKLCEFSPLGPSMT